jgi:hypothetical protein
MAVEIMVIFINLCQSSSNNSVGLVI